MTNFAQRQLASLLVEGGIDEYAILNSFPITTSCLEYLCNNSSKLLEMNKLNYGYLNHNKQVMDNWDVLLEFLISSKELDIDINIENFNEIIGKFPNGLLWVFMDEKLHLLQYANGNPKFPLPSKPIVCNSIQKRFGDGRFQDLAVQFRGFSIDNEYNLKYFSDQENEISDYMNKFEQLSDTIPVKLVTPLTVNSCKNFIRFLQRCAYNLTSEYKERSYAKLEDNIKLHFKRNFKYKLQ